MVTRGTLDLLAQLDPQGPSHLGRPLGSWFKKRVVPGDPELRAWVDWRVLAELKDWPPLAPIRPADLEARRGDLPDAPWVCWQVTEVREDASAMRGLLGEFVDLSGRTPEDVLRFVRKWGPLDLCRHLLPLQHATGCIPLDVAPQGVLAAQPVDLIQMWADKLHAALEFGAAYVVGNVPAPTAAAWHHAADWPGELRRLHADGNEFALTVRDSVSAAAQEAYGAGAFPSLLTGWLDRVSGVRTWLTPQSGPPRRFVPERVAFGLLGALGLQLHQALTEADRILQCDGCGRTYPRSGPLPKRGLRNYCPSCQSEHKKVTVWRKTRKGSEQP